MRATLYEFDRKELALVLAEEQEARAFNLRQFSEWLGVPVSTLWRIQKLKSDPRVVTVCVLFSKLNIDPAKFLRRKA